jgi:Tol biopolymer transport system component
LNDRKEHNWDVWIMGAEGGKQPRPLTQNGSFDASPAISSDGLKLYFFSNRGAQKAGQESLQIFRLDVPAD